VITSATNIRSFKIILLPLHHSDREGFTSATNIRSFMFSLVYSFQQHEKVSHQQRIFVSSKSFCYIFTTVITSATNIRSFMFSGLQLSTTPLLLSTFQYINEYCTISYTLVLLSNTFIYFLSVYKSLTTRFPIHLFFCVTPHEYFFTI
jgi:hypothetical protein